MKDLSHSVLPGAPSCHTQSLQPTLIPSCHRSCRLWLALHLNGPMASFALFPLGKYRTYICPSPLVSPHVGHMTCHSWYPKEWLKGLVVTTWSGYCPLHLFRFLYSTILFHNSFIALVTLFPSFKPVHMPRHPRSDYWVCTLCSPNAPASLV